MNNQKFVIWIAVFLVLLSAIPVLAFQNQFTAAKVVGVFTVVLVSVAIRLWTNASRRNSRKANRVLLNRNDLFWLEKHVPFFKTIKGDEVITFKDRMGLFLANIPFSSAEKELPEREDCFPVAALYVQETWNQEWALPENYNEVKLIDEPIDETTSQVRKVSNELVLNKLSK